MLHVKTDRLSRPASDKGLFLSIQFCLHVQKFEKKKKSCCAMSTSTFSKFTDILCGALLLLVDVGKKIIQKLFIVILKRLDPTPLQVLTDV